MAYMGTTVAAGTASAIVVATGMNTEIGHIAGLLQQQPVEQTPLQKRLAELGRMLVFVVLGIVAVMFARAAAARRNARARRSCSRSASRWPPCPRGCRRS